MSTTIIRSVKDVTAFIDSQPKLANVAKAAWLIALGGLFLDAFANSALGSALAPLTATFDLDPAQVGMLTASSALVALIVNPLGGWMADRIGRVKPLIATKFIYIAGAILTLLAVNFEMVFAGRVMVGIAYGIDFSIAMALLAEYTPAKHRSKLNLWNGIWYIAVISNLVVTLVFTQLGVGQDIWRYSIASSGVLALVILVLQVRYLAESPTWLARIGRTDRAVASLQKLFPQRAFEAGAAETEPSKGSAGNITLLFRGSYRPRTILSGIISLCQYMQYSAVGWYLPVIALALFDENFVAATIAAIVFNLFGVLGGFSSPYFGKRFGLRNSAMYGFAAVFLVLIGMGLLDGKVTPLLLAIFPAALIFFHSAGPASNGKSIAALSYRSEIRASGTAFTGFLANVGAAIGLFVFPVLRGTYDLGTVLLILSVVPLVGFIACVAIPWDPTRNGFSADEETTAPGLEPAGRG
ncbi:MFS transporter [Leucobacter komagatae]|uniref:MFS transporter n=1 Tax=Leucobacter komagatae TaxID=55969 RepID=A0A0D0IKK8_9MICO|nr:MFS transporter [Leucobacter komagatae]KIP51632.1 MFS transporter [Leucobacter komagatae]